METLSSEAFMAFLPTEKEVVRTDKPGLPIAARDGHRVPSYFELLEKVAALNYYNSRFRLLFRGQTKDFKFNMRGELGVHSCLYPSILRPLLGVDRQTHLNSAFDKLYRAEKLLIEGCLWPTFIAINLSVGQFCSTMGFVPRRCST